MDKSKIENAINHITSLQECTLQIYTPHFYVI